MNSNHYIAKTFAALMALCILCTALLACTPSQAATKLQVATPTYPEAVKSPGEKSSTAEYDAWQAYNEKRMNAASGNLSAMDAFYRTTLAQVLGTTKEGKNAVYSPINVYLALAMLTETVDHDSRAQLLSLLGEKDLSALRSRVKKLFTANYQDDGVCTELLANSLWMNESIAYKQATVDALAKYQYAYAFSGKPGSAEMDKALQDWVNEQTHDLLKDQASGLKLDPATVLALVSTIYYKAAWADQFDTAATKKETFHATTGDKKVDMMHIKESFPYYKGKNFEAVALPLKNSGSMWFFLPKKGTDPAALAKDKEALNLLLKPDDTKLSYPQVTLTLPKMDVVSDKDLIRDLKKLGVSDIFDPAKGDFSPLLKDSANTFVSMIEHAARVKTDEEGVEAAAYTAIILSKSALPSDFVTFTVDRPYFFAITGYTGDLLFAGSVSDPAAK